MASKRVSNKITSITEMLQKKGRNVVVSDIYTFQEIWKSWYRGNVQNFHTFKQKGADGNTNEFNRNSMNMAKKVSEDWSSFLWNENVDIVIEDDAANKAHEEVLDNNNDKVNLSDLLEKAFAIGEGYMVQFISNGETVIDYITGDYIIVTAYRNKILGICSYSEFQQGKEWITHITYYNFVKGSKKEENKLIIQHEVFASTEEGELGDEVALTKIFSEQETEAMKNVTTNDKGEEVIWFGIEYVTSTIHFQQIRPNISNNYDMLDVRGISIFANSIDTLRAVDIVDDAMTNEPELGKMRIFVDPSMTQKHIQADVSVTGGQESSAVVREITYYDSNQPVYITVPGMIKDGQPPVIPFAPELRMGQYKIGKDQSLRELGFKTGMGTEYYSLEGGTVYQNEKMIISTNSDLWKNKVKHEIILEQALLTRTRAILFLEQELGNISAKLDVENVKITIKFDDSIIIDDEELRKRDLELVDRDLMPEWMYLVKWESLTEAEAKDWIKQASESDDDEELDLDDDEPTEEEPEPSGDEDDNN